MSFPVALAAHRGRRVRLIPWPQQILANPLSFPMPQLRKISRVRPVPWGSGSVSLAECARNLEMAGR